MANYKKLSSEELDTCLLAFSEDYMLSDANKMRSLESFLDRVTKESYLEMVPKPIVKQRNLVIRRDPDTSKWMYDLKMLSSYICFVLDLPSECSYSKEVEVFISLCNDNSVSSDDSLFYSCKKPSEYIYIDSDFSYFCNEPVKYFYIYGEASYEKMRILANNFTRKLHLRLRTPKTRKKIIDRRRAIEKNYRELIEYIDGLFARIARQLVLRIDLAYKKDLKVRIEDLAKDLDHLHANMRHNQLFHHLTGYIEKIEYGVEKGMHVHALLFFDGSKRKNDAYLTQEIGEYWNNQITKGRGNYWNCNALEYRNQFEKKDRLGIGEIHADDKEKRANLNSIIRYFCKSMQFIKPKSNPKMKLIRKGYYPKQTGLKRGAPRASQRIVRSPYAIGDRPAFSS